MSTTPKQSPQDASEVTQSQPIADNKQVDKSCVFCKRIARGEYDDKFANWVWFKPLNPVVEGHMLIVPVVHTASLNDGNLQGDQAGWALRYFTNGVTGDYNLITSKGDSATQTIQHLHFHVVPRHAGDGLQLPWTNQTKVTDLLTEDSDTNSRSSKAPKPSPDTGGK